MKREARLLEALFPLILLIGLLTANVFIFDDTLAGSNQMALLLAATTTVVISASLGLPWEKIQTRIVKTIGSAMPSILILLLIGSLAGAWMIKIGRAHV